MKYLIKLLSFIGSLGLALLILVACAVNSQAAVFTFTPSTYLVTDPNYTTSSAFLRNLTVSPQGYVGTGVCSKHLFDINAYDKAIGSAIALCGYGAGATDASGQFAGVATLKVIEIQGLSFEFGSDLGRGGAVVGLTFNLMSLVNTLSSAVPTK